MIKKLILGILIVVCLGISTGCTTQADEVNYNLSKEADSFNVVRRVTVINCIEGDVLLQMEGRMSITADVSDDQLEIIVENPDGTYVKHFVGLSDNVTYVIEDLNVGENEVNNYKYTLNFNPKMWIPEIKTYD